MTRRLGLLVAGAVAAAILFPLISSGPNLDRTALALALAGPAAGAALALAAGRPPLVVAALSGVGAYVSALLAMHGLAVPLAVLLGAGAGGAAGALIALLGARLDGPAFLVATLLVAIAGGAAVQALPALTGAEAGLGPIPSLSLSLGGGRTAVLTSTGNFHVMLGVALVSICVAALLLDLGPGPGWRAIGSDRFRARASGLTPLSGEIAALAVGGVLAAVAGACAAHVSRVATPQSFAPDVAALPLLAALAAGRKPVGAALVAVATGLIGEVVLPAVGWQGPPDARSLALGILAVATLFTILPGGGAATDERETEIDVAGPWPLEAGGLRGGRLQAGPVTVLAKGGRALVDAPAFTAEPGTITAVVGPNGAGKSTLLRALESRSCRQDSGVRATLDGTPSGVSLLPQDGGGFAFCTVLETLTLAARAPGRTRSEAQGMAGEWLGRLGLSASGGVLCAELSTGQRRLLDLARVLLTAPGVVLCDEPLAGLDDDHRAAAIACLRAAAAAGATLVVSEHDTDAVAALTNHVVQLERAS